MEILINNKNKNLEKKSEKNWRPQEKIFSRKQVWNFCWYSSNEAD